MNRVVCLKPQDALYNWRPLKDLAGTPKPQLPRIVVTPPAETTTKSSLKTKKRPNKTFCHVAAPPKLVLDPSFWSPQPETPRARKKRFLFKCRNSDCAEQFSSTKLREMHEGHCLSFDEVCIFKLGFL